MGCTGLENGDDISLVSHFLAAGEVLPSQTPATSTWNPERKLAAAVLISGLLEIRNHIGDPHYRRVVDVDLAWVVSDDLEWPFSFLRLCQVFGFEPSAIRRLVREWGETGADKTTRRFSAYVDAA